MKFSRASLYLLLIQLAIVSTVAGKYLYQRWSCPRVWTRAVAYDPETVMRGRYLSLRLTVDGCGRITPPTKLRFPENTNSRYRWYIESQSDEYTAKLAVENNKLVAVPISGPRDWQYSRQVADSTKGEAVLAVPMTFCDALQLQQPVDFYIPEHANDPSRTKPGQELWIEVTVPPKGPPRPLQLALKEADGSWKPLAIQ